MYLKEYQKRALATVREFLEELTKWRDQVEKALASGPELSSVVSGVDWVGEAWKKTAQGRAYAARKNGLGDYLPSFCLKIPTGGGKTLLATKVIDLVNTHYLRRQTGLVLWIVPTTQIYDQTLRALKDRDHPYRQQLDLASANRTVVLEKTSGFSPRNVEQSLCVLLLMLPSANRETKEQLKMFRDRGGFERFFPSDDQGAAHEELLEAVSNLDVFEQPGGFGQRQAKTSLGNALRLLQPLIILDEGHRAYSESARKTLEGFNPRMIVELSATPPPGANVLVDIRGHELNAEGMIKLDLHIRNSASANWQDALLESVEHRQRLEEAAREHEERTSEYIRPICLIQVERTGKDQRRPGLVHAEDAREYLLRHPGIRAEHVAIKTSQRDELKEVDEAGGLLSRDCPIRFIITKQALQEGWDCSFAYVLTILTNPSSTTALTQLVGRILRQPYAQKTRASWLDESYVFCFQRRGADLLQEVRRGFGREGLEGLESRVVVTDKDELAQPRETKSIKQRKRYRKSTRDLVLPAFMIKDGREWRLVYYETDIQSRIPWGEMDASPLFDMELGAGERKNYSLRAGLGAEALLEDPEIPVEWVSDTGEGEIDDYFAAQYLLDVMPNPWWGREVAMQVFDALLEKHPRKKVVNNYLFILQELRKRLEAESDRLSRRVFEELLEAGTMRFIVVAEDLEFNRLPREIEETKEKQANREDGGQYLLNLFEKTGEDELNGLENKIATYLDRQERLFFWHRNRARKDYYVQGWKRGRIYADFIFTLKPDEPGGNDSYHQVFVMETKGSHLKAASDTAYKRTVFDICSQHAKKRDWAEFVPAMRNKAMRFEIVDEDEWEQRLNALIAA